MYAYFGKMPAIKESYKCCDKFADKYEKITGQKYKKSDKEIYNKLVHYGDAAKLPEHKASAVLLHRRQQRQSQSHRQDSAEFKLEDVKRVEVNCASVARVTAELGVYENTLHGWIKRYWGKTSQHFPGSGKLSTENEGIRKLEGKNRNCERKMKF